MKVDNQKLHCDYLIIGGGSSGSVMAGRLSENPDCEVILLEAGGDDNNLLLKIPAAAGFVSANHSHNWNYQVAPQKELLNRRLYLSQAKLIGGGGSINSMVYTRGQQKDYDHWRDLGCEGWSFEEVLPFFKKSENSSRGANRWHGVGGPLQVSKGNTAPLPIAEVLLQAGQSAGIPIVDDFSQADGEGFGYFDVSIGQGLRSSASTAFLNPVRSRENLQIFTHSRANKLLIENGKAVAAEVNLDGKPMEISVDREIILCAGAVHTPQLLMLSGIGPADHLASHHIDVILDIPEVGQNFQNHMTYGLSYSCERPITARRYLNPLFGLPVGLRYLLGRKGYLGAGPAPLGGFYASGETGNSPDLQIFIVPALIAGTGWGVFKQLPSEHGFMVMVNQGKPASRGEIRLQSADINDAPLIDGRYFSRPEDLTTLARGVERIRDTYRGKEIQRIGGKELFDKGGHASLNEIKASIKKSATNHYHVSGTCRMGSDSQSVVDTQLRLRGVDGIRIADTSIMPELINGNTNAPVIMIAERAAEFINNEYKVEK